MILFPAACLLSLVANISRFPLSELLTGSLYLVRWIFYAMLFFSITKKNYRVWLKGLYVVGIGFGILGLLQFFLYPNLRNLSYLGWDPHQYRLFSTLLDPNFMGIIFVFTLLLGYSLLNKKNKVWIIAGEIIAFISLLLTYSRSSYVGLGVAIVVIAILRKQWKFFGGLVAFVVLTIGLSFISGNTVKLTRETSSLARITNWQESIVLIEKAPGFGYGFDTLRYLHPSNSVVPSKAAAGLDSSILFVLATTGIIGLAAYLYLWIAVLLAGKKSVVFLASSAALLVHSVFLNSLFYPWVMIWMWILVGAVIYDR
jgi:O-antigen ligase